jgi:hypothetical protein
LSGEPAAWEMKKGAIIWVVHQLGAPRQVALRAVLSPALL